LRSSARRFAYFLRRQAGHAFVCTKEVSNETSRAGECDSFEENMQFPDLTGVRF
jgi:hypothetical protein